MLLIAGGAAVAAALGGLLLDDSVEDVEKAVQTGNLPGLNLATSPLDENTKLALKVAVALFALVGVSIGETARVACDLVCTLYCFHRGPRFCKASSSVRACLFEAQLAATDGRALLQAHKQLPLQCMKHWQGLTRHACAHRCQAGRSSTSSLPGWLCSRMLACGGRIDPLPMMHESPCRRKGGG